MTELTASLSLLRLVPSQKITPVSALHGNDLSSFSDVWRLILQIGPYLVYFGNHHLCLLGRLWR
jgi:hypothetical protein